MYLLLSILSSTLIFIVFKLLTKYKISTIHTITVNYFVAFAIGISSYNQPITAQNTIYSDWFLGALFLGFLFISIFFVMATTAQKNGVSVASVASKMSVVIPIIFGIYMYNESTGLQKIIGICFALVAVYLASVKSYAQVDFKKNLALPILLFIGSGTIDTSIKYIETTHVPENGIPIFSASIFGIAAILGVLTTLVKKDFGFNLKSLVSGFILGIVNYGSIYFLLKALDHELFESSTLFTVNHVGIMMLSTLVGLLVFREKLSVKNWIGLGLAVVAITLVTLA
ncbi:EamA family transporter [Lacinutrix gracilariae]|uniref:EamA family transporter n=1 Tax=Lacinutrix gracilariae TaxID=1747198 RepID=A0ABW5K5Y5_9FLAO